MKTLLIDNYDSFTYMLKDYIRQCGSEATVIRNDDPGLNTLDGGAYDAVVLSPGPATPARSGSLMPFLEKHIAAVPVLGVCLGHQAIGTLFGAPLVKAREPVHGKTGLIETVADPVFHAIPQRFSVTRYHSLILSEVTDPLEIIATTPSGEIMAIRHKHLPVRGIQFHPESCLSEYGLQIIQNFLWMAAGKC